MNGQPMNADIVNHPNAAASAKRRKHKWGNPIHVPGRETVTGCDQTERKYELCPVVRITVHPPQGLPWREWRKHGAFQAQMDRTPECEDAGVNNPKS